MTRKKDGMAHRHAKEMRKTFFFNYLSLHFHKSLFSASVTMGVKRYSLKTYTFNININCTINIDIKYTIYLYTYNK